MLALSRETLNTGVGAEGEVAQMADHAAKAALYELPLTKRQQKALDRVADGVVERYA